METRTEIKPEDFSLFEDIPDLYLFLSPELIILNASNAYLLSTKTRRENIIGKHLFDVFPDNLLIDKSQASFNLRYSFQYVLEHKQEHKIPVIRYDLQRKDGSFEKKYWSMINKPILGQEGEILYMIHKTEDISASIESQSIIQESKDRIQQVLENLPQITWTAIPSGEINFFSQKWYEYTRLSFEETCNWSWEQVVHPDDYKTVIHAFLESISLGSDFVIESRLKNGRTGQYRWHISRAAPLRNEKGEIILWVGSTTDVHDIKTVEVQLTSLREREKILLEESEKERETLNNIFRDAPAMIAVLKGPTHVFLMVNEEYRKLLGNRDVIGKPVSEALPEMEVQGIITLLNNVYDSGVPFKGNELPITINSGEGNIGEERFYNFIYKLIHDNEGNKEGIFAFGYEVTEQVLARRRLQESEQRLQRAQKAGNIGTFEWALETNKITFTPQVEVIFGFAPGAWEGNYSNAIGIVHPEDKERIAMENQQAIDERKNVDIEHRIIRPDGSIRWLNSKGELFLDNAGSPEKVIGVIIDITERKESEEQLEKQNKQLTRINNDLDNFVYTVSHDLKAPIANLEGLLNFLRKGLENRLNDKDRGLFRMIDSSVARFKGTIKDLTEITKLEANLNEDVEKVDFDDVYEAAFTILQQQLVETNATIYTEFEVGSIRFSKKDLNSILYNLLSNAIKYSSPDRRPIISLKTVKEGDFVVLSVKDNGLGIDVKNTDKVFGMFKRLHTHVEGSGIGLYIVKKIVENNDGKIEIESQVGVGTTFKIFLLQK